MSSSYYTKNIFIIIKEGNIEEYLNIVKEIDINIQDEFKQTLLHISLASNQLFITNDLISRGVNVDIQDDKGQTPLHILPFYPNIEVAEKLLKKSTNLNLKDSFGNNPLWYAVFNARGNYDIVNLYLDYKASPYNINNFGRSPIDFSLQINDKILHEKLTKTTKP